MDYTNIMESAKLAQKNSYSPFSKFKVGAALLTKSGKIFKGCNVENSSYPVCNCAERTAIFSAVANGEKDFVAIAITGGNGDEFCYPCGICRQTLVEFNPDMDVVVFNNKNEVKVLKAKELLPNYFTLKEEDK